MNRDEFMGIARRDIDEIAHHYRNRLMNLVEQAWIQGKRCAETETIVQMMTDALEKCKDDMK